MKALQKIFSITNSQNRKFKIISCCGLKIKIYRKNKDCRELETRIIKLENENRWLINQVKTLRNFHIEHKIRENYNRVLEKLKQESKTRKINVIFLCNTTDCAKFSYSSLYEEFIKNQNFNTKILVSYTTAFTHNEYEKMTYKETIKNGVEYFKKKKWIVEYAYDIEKEEFLDLKRFEPDIIFYTEPWEISPLHDLPITSKFALSCFCCYGTTIHNGDYEYTGPFYRNLFKYFMDNYDAEELMIDHDVVPESIEVFGSIKLDAYLSPIDYSKRCWKFEDKKRVIYAPHHAFSPKSILKYGTFDKNYRFFLDYAKNHPDIEFILKPHPVLKKQIITHNLMNQEEMESYFLQWESLPNAQICECGEYYDMFRTSDLLITDCNSFLSEYLPTEKPVIHLISEHSIGYNSYGEKIIAGYYPATTNEETEKLMDNILYKGLDPLINTRKKILETDFVWNKDGVAEEIVKYLEKIIFKD